MLLDCIAYSELHAPCQQNYWHDRPAQCMPLASTELQRRWRACHASALSAAASQPSPLPVQGPATVTQQHVIGLQAYEGLQTAVQLRQEFLLVPAKVKDVYLVHLLEQLADLKVRSAIIFCSTCGSVKSC